VTKDTITKAAATEDADAELVPGQLADMAASAAELAEAAAEHAASAAAKAAGHRTRSFAYAARAEGAKQRADALVAADAASAADAEATRTRRALADAEVHVGFAMRYHDLIAKAEGDHGAELAAAAEAIDRAEAARGTAQDALDAAEAEARTAGQGVDWLRYHLDNHCRHWRERVDPPTDDELAATTPGPEGLDTADEADDSGGMLVPNGPIRRRATVLTADESPSR
jgi:hypothetical protein